MAARKRRLTPEERQLWEQVKATALPLRPQPASPEEKSLPDVPARAQPMLPSQPPPADLTPTARVAPRTRIDLAPDPHVALSRANPQMDRRRFDKLRRGKLEPEARIDLHGMTLERAHAALTRFLLDAHAKELRLVLVITGKGRQDDTAIQPHRHGILRHSVPHWLSGPPLVGRVLQLAPAHQRHGGAGAFYVYLRRQR